jgi:hypothetical protein
MECDFCVRKPRWNVYAAYILVSTGTHQQYAGYPNAMSIVCDDHLPIRLQADMSGPSGETSTRTWIITPAIE